MKTKKVDEKEFDDKKGQENEEKENVMRMMWKGI